MDDVNVNSEMSDAGYSARVRFRSLVSIRVGEAYGYIWDLALM